MKRLLCIPVALLLAACAGSRETLTVKQFMMRDQTMSRGEEPMVRMEKNRHLRGAVSMEDRGQRLGQYYTVLWNDPEGIGKGEVEVTFQFQQGATASRVKHLTKTFPTGAASGKAEFAVIGDDYLKNGRVLAWQVILSRGGRQLASKRSYLWQ